MEILWKAKICSGMDLVEKIKFIKEGTDAQGNKATASAVYIPSGDEQYKIRADWTNEEIDAIANKLSDDLDVEITRQLETATP
tara:strand:+ start:254 stop:502 length:249 start_codon:yes stop_codon:yes gene_type:complete